MNRFWICALFSAVVFNSLVVLGEENGARYRGPVIDVHMHALPDISDRSMRSPSTANFPLMLEQVESLTAAKVVEMEANQVRVGLLNGMNPNARALAAKYRDRVQFIPGFFPYMPGFSKNDRLAGSGSIENFKRKVREGKVGYLGEIVIAYGGVSIGDPRFKPWFAACQEVDVPALVHCGYGGPMPPKDFRLQYSDPTHLRPVLAEFPKLQVVICHLAWPYVNETVEILKNDSYKGRVWVDTGAVCWDLSPEFLAKVLAEYMVASDGSDQILFGSDSMSEPARITKGIKNLSHAIRIAAKDDRITEDAESILSKVFYRNAARFLKLKDKNENQSSN